MTLDEIIARWDSGEGRPFKGRLIAWGDGDDPPEGIGCMCAQGQVLHLIGERSKEWLREVAQHEADIETARLMNISRAHAVLLRQINDSVDGAPSIVLTDPGDVLGEQWSKVLDFWWHLDALTRKQWDVAGRAAWDAARAAWDAARAAWDAARAAWDAAGRAAGDAARSAARYATYEIQGAEILRRDGGSFFFLPIFGFSSPDDIPPRPADYGVVK
jgi:hypothetical protein